MSYESFSLVGRCRIKAHKLALNNAHLVALDACLGAGGHYLRAQKRSSISVLRRI